jgi:hypothetical protein
LALSELVPAAAARVAVMQRDEPIEVDVLTRLRPGGQRAFRREQHV